MKKGMRAAAERRRRARSIAMADDPSISASTTTGRNIEVHTDAVERDLCTLQGRDRRGA